MSQFLSFRENGANRRPDKMDSLEKLLPNVFQSKTVLTYNCENESNIHQKTWGEQVAAYWVLSTGRIKNPI